MTSAETLAYGPHQSQQLDVRLTDADHGKPLVVLLHGGFWRQPYDRQLMQPLARDLLASGYPVANVDYRRIGEPGGGWPGTFEDVAEAVRVIGDAAPREQSSQEAQRDCVVIGHSAGGTLALWLAGEATRSRIGRLRLRLVVSLAGVTDLRTAALEELGCGQAGVPAAVELLEGWPAECERAYRAASPIERVPSPPGPATQLFHGDRDGLVPWSQSTSYAERVRATGDSVGLQILAGGGHFELIDPSHRSWRHVMEGLTSFIQGPSVGSQGAREAWDHPPRR